MQNKSVMCWRFASTGATFDEGKVACTGRGEGMRSRHDPVDDQNRNFRSQSKVTFTTGVLLTNIRSLPSKFLELRAVVEEKRPTVVAITETWLTDEMNDAEFSIDGYSTTRQDRQNSDKARGGGVALFTRNDIDICKCEALCRSRETESVFVLAKFKCGKSVKKLLIGNIYRPPKLSLTVIDECCNLLNEAGKLGKKLNAELLILGDFNLPGIDWEHYCTKACIFEARFLQAVSDNFLSQIVLEPTREQNILDLVLVTNPSQITKVEVLEPIGRSDHNCVHIESNYGINVTSEAKEVLSIRRTDFCKMSRFFHNIDWESYIIPGSGSIEESWSKFLNIYHEAIRRYVPKTVVKSGTNPKKTLTLSRDVRKQILKKRRLWRKWKKSGRKEDELGYKKQRKLVTEIIRGEEYEKQRALFRSINSEPAKFWAYVRSKREYIGTIGPLKNKQGNLVSDDKEVADELNNFFQSVFVDEPDTNDVGSEISYSSDEGSLVSVTFVPEAVERAILEIKAGKSGGPDGVHGEILRKCAKQLAVPLSMLFQKSLDNGKLPLDWKMANVVPIYKGKGSREEPGNYRPVCLTSHVVKTMERIIRARLSEFSLENDLISKNQHGFQAGKSCGTQLLTVFEDWTKALEDRSVSVDVIYLDIQKAFDTVPHTRLLKRLSDSGIRGNLLHWLRSFLVERSQKVFINGSTSTTIKVKSGVPQGSVLGPFLFLVYINPMIDAVLQTGVTGVAVFADDSKIYQVRRNQNDWQILQGALDALSEWSKNSLLKFHPKKCKVLSVGNSKKVDYFLDGEKLEHVDEIVDLGIVVANDLKPSKQCTRAAKRANRALGVIHRNFK